MDSVPIILGVITLLSVVYFLWGIPAQFVRKHLSANWPWTTSSIHEHSISELSSRGASAYKLTVSYSYSVEGVTYTGTYSEICDSQSAAEGCLRSLKDLPPPVRYKPGKPQVSAMDPYRDAGLAFAHPDTAS
jgi:hypothetical protein